MTSVKTPPILYLLAGMLALTLVSCGEKPAKTPAATPTPAIISTPEPTPTPVPIPSLEPVDVGTALPPPGDYAPWQEAYMEFIIELCEKEKPLRQWAQEATAEEIEADPERARAVNDQSDSYFLYDVDKDGIPELFIQYGVLYIPWIECYTYRNGEMTQIGEISGDAKGANFFTWPEKNAILNYWAWKGAFILWEYSIVDGELVRVDEDGIASQFGGPGEPDPRDYVLHTLPLEFHRIRTTRPDDDSPMLLPICNYGGRALSPATREERRIAREAIEEVLYRGGLFYSLSGNSIYGDSTGWTTLEKYCQEEIGKRHGTVSPSELVWLDLNGDSTEECVVRFLELDESARYHHMTVFSWQTDVVYGYDISYYDGNALSADGKFYVTDPLWIMDEIRIKNFAFHQNQCYFEAAPRPENLVPASWEPFSP